MKHRFIVGHALGLLAGAGLTRPAQNSDATSFGGILNILSFRSDILNSFILRILCSLVALALGNEQNSGFPEISKNSRAKRERIQREPDQSIALANELRIPPSKAQNNVFTIRQPRFKVVGFPRLGVLLRIRVAP